MKKSFFGVSIVGLIVAVFGFAFALVDFRIMSHTGDFVLTYGFKDVLTNLGSVASFSALIAIFSDLSSITNIIFTFAFASFLLIFIFVMLSIIMCGVKNLNSNLIVCAIFFMGSLISFYLGLTLWTSFDLSEIATTDFSNLTDILGLKNIVFLVVGSVFGVFIANCIFIISSLNFLISLTFSRKKAIHEVRKVRKYHVELTNSDLYADNDKLDDEIVKLEKEAHVHKRYKDMTHRQRMEDQFGDCDILEEK